MYLQWKIRIAVNFVQKWTVFVDKDNLIAQICSFSLYRLQLSMSFFFIFVYPGCSIWSGSDVTVSMSARTWRTVPLAQPWTRIETSDTSNSQTNLFSLPYFSCSRLKWPLFLIGHSNKGFKSGLLAMSHSLRCWKRLYSPWRWIAGEKREFLIFGGVFSVCIVFTRRKFLQAMWKTASFSQPKGTMSTAVKSDLPSSTSQASLDTPEQTMELQSDLQWKNLNRNLSSSKLSER